LDKLNGLDEEVPIDNEKLFMRFVNNLASTGIIRKWSYKIQE